MSLIELICAICIMAVAGGTGLAAWYSDSRLINSAVQQRMVDDCADSVAEEELVSPLGAVNLPGCTSRVTVQSDVYGIHIGVVDDTNAQQLELFEPAVGAMVVHAVYGYGAM